jgi:hypothetical protein
MKIWTSDISNPWYADIYDNWKNKHLPYFKDEEYKPQSCDKFCPYKDLCNHGKNILSTSAKPKRRTIEKLENYKEEFVSIEEAEADFEQVLMTAVHADASV